MNVDHPEVPTVEWFFGYGGNHLGLRRVIPGLRLIAACEIEAFVNANMVSKMEAGLLDAAPCWSDCRTFPAKPFKNRVALFIASYPCQGFSLAGKRLGKDDPRHLWPHVRRFEQTARPLWVFFENVRGHVSLGLSTVLSDLREDGYRTEWGIFSAAECGAPHNRERVFILGRLSDAERERWGEHGNASADRNEEKTSLLCSTDAREKLADGIQQGLQGHAGDGDVGSESRRIGQGSNGSACSGCLSRWPSRPGEEQYPWEPPRITAGKLAHPSRLHGAGEGRQLRGGRGVCEAGEDLADTGIGLVQDEGRGSQGRTGAGSAGESVGDAENPDWWSRECGAQERTGEDGIRRRGSCEPDSGQTEPPVGRDSYGCPYRLDNAELYESCDNRTDELRLLGNGVSPDTAERAFIILYGKLIEAIV